MSAPSVQCRSMTNPTSDPPFSPEQYKLAVQLESIFMPHARRQRLDAGYGEDETCSPVRFVHYTSAEAALKIIRAKRLWMRNATCMVDFREVQHGLDILSGFFSNQKNRDALLNSLDRCHLGIGRSAIDLFDQKVNDIRLETYIASISEHDDSEDVSGRLSMWRAFGSGSRVALVLRIPKFTGATLRLGLLFSPVAYLSEAEAARVFAEVTANIEKNTAFLASVPKPVILETVFLMLQAASVCLKHEGFREEREWRAIYSPTFRPSSLMETSIEVLGTVPQPVYHIPLESSVSPGFDLADLFDRLIIGPTAFPWATYQAFVSALRDAGCHQPEERVFVSNIPIRS
jgi:hypothetical protein